MLTRAVKFILLSPTWMLLYAEADGSRGGSLRGTGGAQNGTAPSCSPPLGDCGATNCCAAPFHLCFETTQNSFSCLPHCVPGLHDLLPSDSGNKSRAEWTCRLPFTHQLAQARESFRWPDVSSICGSSLVLVNADAFARSYKSDCMEYCREGAGMVVHPSFHQYWISVRLEVSTPGRCPGDDQSSYGDAVPCHCSFPDRRA